MNLNDWLGLSLFCGAAVLFVREGASAVQCSRGSAAGGVQKAEASAAGTGMQLQGPIHTQMPLTLWFALLFPVSVCHCF